MSMAAAQSAASSVAAGTSAAGAAAGSSGLVGAVTGATMGTKAAVVAATVVAVAIGAGVGLSRKSSNPYCPDVGDYKIYKGRLDIFFESPLELLTLKEGEELKGLVLSEYNDFFGCESDNSRLMLDTTTLRCDTGANTCCELVETPCGDRMLCEFETASHCAGCWKEEPLFYENEDSIPPTNTVAKWPSGIAQCFAIDLSRSSASKACVPARPCGANANVPTAAPTTAYPTFSPSTSTPTLSPLTTIVFSGDNPALPTTRA